jgi:hypothetical protein
MRSLNIISQLKFISKRKKLKDKILTKIEEQVKLLDKNFVKKYFNLNNSIKLEFKFYAQSILFNHLVKFKMLTNTILLNINKIFKIR